MDTLFTTDLAINGKIDTFAVSFHNDQYLFKSLNSGTEFSLRREDDEWHTADSLDSQLKNAAVDKLEAYLLSQH